MFKKWSEWLMMGFVLTSLAFASKAMAASIQVTDNNHTYRKYDATNSIRGGGTVSYTLGRMSSHSAFITEPSSGTTTLSAFFVAQSSNSVGFSCLNNYNVAMTSMAVVDVYDTSGTFHCNVSFMTH